MSKKITHRHFVERRAELMAELFLQELEPEFLSRPTQDFAYDLLVGFKNGKGGINTFAVQVKATELPPPTNFPLPRGTFERLTSSNIPVLLLVADAKQNRLYYAWLSTWRAHGTSTGHVPLTEVDDGARRRLQKELTTANGSVAVLQGS